MRHRSVRRTAVAIAIVAGVLPAVGAVAHASTSVNCASRSLQTAINAAAANSTLLIKGTCSGTFTVAKNITLRGNPSATLDGNDLGSVLTITGAPTVHLIALTITGGLASAGAGINSAGGSLNLSKVTVTDNLAFSPTMAQGGGIYSASGSVNVVSSSITANRVLSSATGTDDALSNGGAIFALGNLVITNSSLNANRVTAISPGNLSTADGGAVYAAGAKVSISKSQLNNNRVTVSGLQAIGGAGGCQCGTLFGSLSISHSTLNANIVRSKATNGQSDVSGGGISSSVKTATILDSTLAGNQAVAVEASAGTAVTIGGAISEFATTAFTVIGSRITGTSMQIVNPIGQAVGFGGAVFARGVLNLTSTVVTDTFVSFHAAEGSNMEGDAVSDQTYTGHPARLTLHGSTVANTTATVISTTALAIVQGGGIHATVPLSMVNSTVSGNTSHVVGSIGGQVFGGGVDATWDFAGSAPKDHFTNSTIANNVASAKTSTGTAVAHGGGVWFSGPTATLTDATVARNSVAGSGPTVDAVGGGVFVDISTTTTIEATIVAINSAPTSAAGPDCSGALGSAGHNLLRSKAGCTFAAKSSDKVGVSAGLGPLASNGGPTRTIALQKASPAVDAIAKSACLVKTDQRGVHRPQAKRCDIGAYERKVAKPKH